MMKSLRQIREASRHAKKGGEIGVNGYRYKGGQFLPSTEAPPGTWKIGKKTVTAGREQIAPGKWDHQPTPFSRSIYTVISGWCTTKDDKLELRKGIRDYNGEEITPESEVRPGVKGVMGKEAYTMQELIDHYNKGARWIDVNPDADDIRKN